MKLKFEVENTRINRSAVEKNGIVNFYNKIRRKKNLFFPQKVQNS